MYKVIIELKKDISEDVLKKLTEIINAAFDNRGGKVSDFCADSLYRFEFAGETENEYGCLQLGILNLKESVLFRAHVSECRWLEDDDDECCDVLEIFAKTIR